MNIVTLILAVCIIIFTAIGQILLKIGAIVPSTRAWIPSSLKPYLNRYTLSGYGFLFMVTILSIYVLKVMPLKVFVPLFLSVNVIAVTIFSRIFLHESLGNQKMMGICVIISGILIFSL
jgi:multidrug transporter EmrE-like cation transporter